MPPERSMIMKTRMRSRAAASILALCAAISMSATLPTPAAAAKSSCTSGGGAYLCIWVSPGYTGTMTRHSSGLWTVNGGAGDSYWNNMYSNSWGHVGTSATGSLTGYVNPGTFGAFKGSYLAQVRRFNPDIPGTVPGQVNAGQ